MAVVNNQQLYVSDNKLNVAEAQKYLRAISSEENGIPKLFPDGIYGPETTRAVAIFQQINGLPVTGNIDLDTWNTLRNEYDIIQEEKREPFPVHIYPSRNFVIKPGYVGYAVYVIQIMLNVISGVFKNIQPLSISGIYDQDTSNAVSEFQRVTTGKVTGNVDKETWDNMTKVHKEYRTYGENS